MTPETRLTREIMLWCGERNWLCFKVNVGTVMTEDGRPFSTGLPTGFSDLLIFTNSGKTILCETKIKPRKPTDAQLKFISEMNSRGFMAFVAYSLQEFIQKATSF